MDPDALGPILAGAAALLALLGARRQHEAPEGNHTAGQQLASFGTVAAGGTADALRRGGNATANGTLSIGRTAVATANDLAAGTARVTAHLANGAAALAIGVVGQVAAQTSGLLLDGAGSLVGGLTSPGRRALGRRPGQAPSPGRQMTQTAIEIVASTQPEPHRSPAPSRTRAVEASVPRARVASSPRRTAPAKKTAPAKRAAAPKRPTQKRPASKRPAATNGAARARKRNP